jgi:acyl carrier protein
VSENVQLDLDLDELRALVAGTLELPIEDITDEARFDEDLGVDSLISLEIATRLEKHYGIKISDSDLQDVGSFKKVRELMETKLSAKSTA